MADKATYRKFIMKQLPDVTMEELKSWVRAFDVEPQARYVKWVADQQQELGRLRRRGKRGGDWSDEDEDDDDEVGSDGDDGGEYYDDGWELEGGDGMEEAEVDDEEVAEITQLSWEISNWAENAYSLVGPNSDEIRRAFFASKYGDDDTVYDYKWDDEWDWRDITEKLTGGNMDRPIKKSVLTAYKEFVVEDLKRKMNKRLRL